MKNVLKCMKNVWENVFNWTFQYDAIIGCKFSVRERCRASRAQSYYWWSFSNTLSNFREKLNIKIFHYRKCIEMDDKWMEKCF